MEMKITDARRYCDRAMKQANQRRVLVHVVERPGGAIFKQLHSISEKTSLDFSFSLLKKLEILFNANFFEDVTNFSNIIRTTEAN